MWYTRLTRLLPLPIAPITDAACEHCAAWLGTADPSGLRRLTGVVRDAGAVAVGTVAGLAGVAVLVGAVMLAEVWR